MTLRDFLAGLHAGLHGLAGAVGNRRVRRAYLRLVAVLIVVTLGLYGLGAWPLLWVTRVGDDAAWYAAAGIVALRIVGLLVLLLAAPLVALLLVNAGLPLLAEELFLISLEELSPARAAALREGEGLGLAASVVGSLRRLARYVGLTLVIALVSLVPLVGTVVAPVAQAYVTARSLGWELLEAYLSLSGRGHRAQRDYVRRHRMPLLGFAVLPTLVLAVPLVGAFLFGIAQASAARLIVEVLEPEQSEPE